ncbi:MAG: MGMT family protein [Patescibacteria group bacterium]
MDFYVAVTQLVKRIPRGRVATYGQIAGLISTPRAARVVGTALRHLPPDIPWQRVINAHGMISIENLDCPKELQAQLLTGEGVMVKKQNGNYWVDLKKYQWQPTHKPSINLTT